MYHETPFRVAGTANERQGWFRAASASYSPFRRRETEFRVTIGRNLRLQPAPLPMKTRLLLLLLVLLSTWSAPAQTPLGQPTLDEAKVQIWCATVRWVYDDGGHPALKPSVACQPGNLAALAASIQADSLKVYSLLYAPIEARTSLYTGKKDNPARLQALVKAIVQKLRASPARRRDPARMQRLAALEKALTDYATAGTPPGEVAAAMLPEVADTALAAAAPLGAAEAAEAESRATEAAAVPLGGAAPGAGVRAQAVSLFEQLATPLALILSTLALVIFAVQRISMARWSRQQRRETLAARQAATAATAAAEGTHAAVADTAARLQRAEALVRAATDAPPTPAAVPNELSPAQRLEVERLVSQRVDEELRWLRQQLPQLLAEAVAQKVAAPGDPAVAPENTGA